MNHKICELWTSIASVLAHRCSWREPSRRRKSCWNIAVAWNKVVNSFVENSSVLCQTWRLVRGLTVRWHTASLLHLLGYGTFKVIVSVKYTFTAFGQMHWWIRVAQKNESKLKPVSLYSCHSFANCWLFLKNLSVSYGLLGCNAPSFICWLWQCRSCLLT